MGRVDEIRRIRCLDNSKQKKGREKREAGNKRLFSGRSAGISADQFVEGTGVEGEVEGLSGLSRNTCLHLTPPPVFLLELPLSALSCLPEPPAPPHSSTEARPGLHPPGIQPNGPQNLSEPRRNRASSCGKQLSLNILKSGSFFPPFLAFEPSVFKGSAPPSRSSQPLKLLSGQELLI